MTQSKCLLAGIALAVASTALLTSCSTVPRAPEQFPEADIVFQTVADPGFDADFRIGFVNADGSGGEYVTIWAPGANTMESSPVYPLILSDNSLLIMRGMTATGYPGRLAAFVPGKLAELCSDDKALVIGPVTLTQDEEDVVAGLTGLPSWIAVFDLEACLAGGVYADEGGYSVLDIPGQFVPCLGGGAALSAGREKLAFSDCSSHEPTVTVVNLATGVGIVVGPGIAPSWSPEADSIAYRGPGGIYVAGADGTGIRLVVEYVVPREPGRYEEWPAFPSWSPDGDWLVYHKCLSITGSRDDCRKSQDFAIFKVNVESGEEIKILDGGLNPYWRQQ